MKINCFCGGEKDDCVLHKLVKTSAVYFWFLPTEYSRLLQTPTKIDGVTVPKSMLSKLMICK